MLLPPLGADPPGENADHETLEMAPKGGLDITPCLKWFLGRLDHSIDGADQETKEVPIGPPRISP